MADKDDSKVAEDYYVEVSFVNQGGLHVKGSNSLDWGMKKHLGNVLDSKSRNVAMSAFDHGYFMGSIAGLERLNLLTPELSPCVDVLMGAHGALCTCVPSGYRKAVALRITSGSSILSDGLSHGVIAVDIEDCIRMDADCMATQTLVGVDEQLSSLDSLSHIISTGLCHGTPAMGAVAVGRQMERANRFSKLAARLLAELGANIAKVYYCENLEEVVSTCPVPVVAAGGKKLPEDEALTLVYHSISESTRGLDTGRNIFQSENPAAMAETVGKIIHYGLTDKQTFEFYQDATHQ